MGRDCKTIDSGAGSRMIIGCGTQPCRCEENAALFAKYREEDPELKEALAFVATSDAEAPENETEQERVLRRRRAFMPDYDRRLQEWLS